MLCSYGCGKEAIHQFKNGVYCCSKNQSSCISIRKKKSISTKGRVGKKHSEETKKKISESTIGKNGRFRKKYKKRLTIKQIKKIYPIFSKIEEMRYKPGTKEIQVHCKNHKCINSKEGWFTPTRFELFTRIYSIEKDYGYGESNLYCSEKCKQECPTFNYHHYEYNNEINYTPEEYQIWRKTVLERANYLCEYCEKKATTSHHLRPQKLEPGFVLDPDFGIACCRKCHYKYGHKTGTECSTGNLSITYCNN